MQVFPEVSVQSSVVFVYIDAIPREFAGLLQMLMVCYHHRMWLLPRHISGGQWWYPPRLSDRTHSSDTTARTQRSFRSGQSDQTPNPAEWVSSFPLGFLLKPRKWGSDSLASGTLRLLRSKNREDRANSLTSLSSLFSICRRWEIRMLV